MLENLVHGLMRQAGLEPKHIMEAYQFVTSLRGELDAFKGGMPQVITHFNRRIDALEAKLDLILAALNAMPADRNPLPPGIPIASVDAAPVITQRMNGGPQHE